MKLLMAVDSCAHGAPILLYRRDCFTAAVLLLTLYETIHLIPKWPPFKYSFVSMQIGPYGLVQG